MTAFDWLILILKEKITFFKALKKTPTKFLSGRATKKDLFFAASLS